MSRRQNICCEIQEKNLNFAAFCLLAKYFVLRLLVAAKDTGKETNAIYKAKKFEKALDNYSLQM